MPMKFTEFFRDLHQEMQYQPSNAVFLYVVGKNLAKRNKTRLLNGVTSIASGSDIKRLVAEFKAADIGTLGLARTEPRRKEFLFTLKNSIFKTSLKRPSCSVVGGMLAGVLEEVSGFYAGCIETACVSKGDRQCEFKARIVGKEPLR